MIVSSCYEISGQHLAPTVRGGTLWQVAKGGSCHREVLVNVHTRPSHSAVPPRASRIALDPRYPNCVLSEESIQYDLSNTEPWTLDLSYEQPMQYVRLHSAKPGPWQPWPVSKGSAWHGLPFFLSKSNSVLPPCSICGQCQLGTNDGVILPRVEHPLSKSPEQHSLHVLDSCRLWNRLSWLSTPEQACFVLWEFCSEARAALGFTEHSRLASPQSLPLCLQSSWLMTLLAFAAQSVSLCFLTCTFRKYRNHLNGSSMRIQ